MATPQTEAPQVKLTTNLIAGDKFYIVGELTPFTAETLPEHLRSYVVTAATEADEEVNQPRATFQTGVVYQLTDDGRLGRAVRRQAAQMEAAAEEDASLEEEANTELPPEIARGLQEQHESHTAFAAAQMRADAARADSISDGA
jgi:hypothetical protein